MFIVMIQMTNKEKKKLRNELYEAVYKGDVDELIDVIGGKKKVKTTIMNKNVSKWFNRHVYEYLYYLSGVIVLLIYLIFTQTTVNENDANEAAAVLSSSFDKAAQRTR